MNPPFTWNLVFVGMPYAIARKFAVANTKSSVSSSSLSNDSIIDGCAIALADRRLQLKAMMISFDDICGAPPHLPRFQLTYR